MSNAIPPYQDFMRPLLELLNRTAGPAKAGDITVKLADEMKLSEEARTQLLPSGKQATYKNRIGWACTYLRFAGLVVSPARGQWVLTDAGQKLLASHKGRVDIKLLETIPAFREARGSDALDPGPASNGASAQAAGATPEEQFLAAHSKIVASVAEELAKLLQAADPAFFEEIVIDLLGKMGYGTSDSSRVHVGKSGDGGIDGVISLDKLGLEKIYIQAKRWAPDRTVGRPDIQAFYGALAGQRATKGLFMTTARFSAEAVQFAQNVSGSLILIEGRRLVQLMIDYGVGVAVAQTLTVPRIDTDYFEP